MMPETKKSKPVKIHPAKDPKPKRVTAHLMPAWQPGQGGNPAGRPPGSRSKFSEAMVSDFLDWHEHGTDVLARVRATEPATYLRVAAVLVPKELNVAFEQRAPGNLEPEAWATLRRVLDISAGITLHVHQ
jgi:hypothetical protein